MSATYFLDANHLTVVTLLDQTEITGDGNTDEGINLDREPSQADFDLFVSATELDSGVTLDVYVQTSVDGTNWIDIAHFPQIDGDGNAHHYVMRVDQLDIDTALDVAASLDAGSERDILGLRYRVRYDTGSETTATGFTTTVTARFKQ